MTRMIIVVTVVVAVALTEFVNANTDYCHLPSCKEQPHTLCTFDTPEISEQCTNFQGAGLTEKEKKDIVDTHNILRHQVASGKEHRGRPGPQPPARFMRNMTWDYELEAIAQRWASQCTFGYDKCRNVERFKVGQNIAYFVTSDELKDVKVEAIVRAWYDDVVKFNSKEVSHYRGRAESNYSQIVWAKSVNIGCGVAKFIAGGMKKFYLVCNYGPRGNVHGARVYKTL